MLPENRTVYLNGRFMPLKDAHISVMDRGFLFGDGVYEVIPVFYNQPFAAKQHIKRLQKSLAATRLHVDRTETDWLALLQALITRNLSDSPQAFYMQVTRGSAFTRTHCFPEQSAPTIFAQCTPYSPVSEKSLAEGSKAILVPDFRRQTDSCIKSISLLPNVLISQMAKENQAKEAIMVHQGQVTEGGSSNLFMVKNNKLYTPPKETHILHGITRAIIFDIAQKTGTCLIEAPISATSLKTADEIWVTGSIKEIVPITQLDEYPIANRVPGPLWRMFFRHYQDYKPKNTRAT